MKTINIISCNITSDMMKENNDCAVKALAITLQIPYDLAHAHFRRIGRKNGMGVTGVMILRALTRSTGDNYTHDNVGTTRGEFGRHVTPRTFAQLMPKGHYLCITRNHAIAVVDGVVEDWTAQRNHKIKAYIEVKAND